MSEAVMLWSARIMLTSFLFVVALSVPMHITGNKWLERIVGGLLAIVLAAVVVGGLTVAWFGLK